MRSLSVSRRLPPVALVLLAAAPAAADPRPTAPVQLQSGKVCLDTLGGRHAPACRTTIGSRILTDPNICLCPAGYREAPAPYCEPGEAPAPDSKDADRARLQALQSTGTLLGATYQGRRFCVTRGRTGENG